jgi:GNAT superfamily N-acetyltransferase
MVTIRPAALADAAAVVRVRVRSWQQAYVQIMPAGVLAALDGQVDDEIERVRERWSAPQPRRYTTLVADDRGTVTGFATYGPYRLDPRNGDRAEPSIGEVVLIYVDPSYQRAGAGRALMDACVAGLRSGGASELRLWVIEENAPARRFYEWYGLVADGGRHLFEVSLPAGGTVAIPEVRYALPLDQHRCTPGGGQ